MTHPLSNLVRLPWTGSPVPTGGCDCRAFPGFAADADLTASAAACPTGAVDAGAWRVDLGRCVQCGLCAASAPHGVWIGKEQVVATTRREELVIGAEGFAAAPLAARPARSLHIREVDAGSCNGCDWEAVSLTGPDYDLQHLGFDIVASPRHADVLLVTGPPSAQMAYALRDAYAMAPQPCLVVACGACAISGGVFAGSYAAGAGVSSVVPVDVWIPGCPPRPPSILRGLTLAAQLFTSRRT